MCEQGSRLTLAPNINPEAASPMFDPTLDDHPIMQQVKHAIVLNRYPGYHFVGNFVGQVFNQVQLTQSLLTLPLGEHLLDKHGQVHVAAFAIITDMGLATGIRSGLEPSTRLATVSLSLQLTSAPRYGELTVASASEGFVIGAAGKEGLSSTKVHANGELVCFGTGSFMILPPPPGVELHPIPWIKQLAPTESVFDPAQLTESEAEIVKLARVALHHSSQEGGDFLTHFLGFYPEAIKGAAHCVIKNGPHIGNRVGHVQGGITLTQAMVTANAALGEGWLMTAVHASYISPGQGETITSDSKVVHHGRMTAVVRTKLMSSNGRQVLDVVSNHVKRP